MDQSFHVEIPCGLEPGFHKDDKSAAGLLLISDMFPYYLRVVVASALRFRVPYREWKLQPRCPHTKAKHPARPQRLVLL